MSNNIEELKGALVYGGARPTLFEVTFQAPVAINRGGDLSKIHILCKAASIPGAALGTIPLFYKGREVPFPGDRTFQPWTITVIHDEDFAIRRALTSWGSAINEHQNNIRSRGATGNPYSYRADLTVVQLNKNGFPVHGWTMVGGWPSDTSEIPLSYDTTNTIAESPVTFTYDYWTSIDTDGFSQNNFVANLAR